MIFIAFLALAVKFKEEKYPGLVRVAAPVILAAGQPASQFVSGD
jgi:hypothetical protein